MSVEEIKESESKGEKEAGKEGKEEEREGRSS